MGRRRMGPLPEVSDQTSLGCKVAFTFESIQAIFDELYNAKWVENQGEKKRTGKKQHIRVEEQVEIDAAVSSFVCSLVSQVAG